MHQLQIPGVLGPFDRFALIGHLWPRDGWTLEMRHRHAREALNCPYVVRLEALSPDEAWEAIESYLAAGQHRFSWDSEGNRCSSSSSL